MRLVAVHASRYPFFTMRQADAMPSGVAKATPATATATPIQRSTSDAVIPGLAAVWTTSITV
jgi:hypothetical protein